MSKEKHYLYSENLNINNNLQKQSNSLQNGYALSSWNYGSFHYSNPRYTKIDKPVKLIKDETAQNESKNQQRPEIAQLNKFGKRKLGNDEKIVTEDLLKAINDNKNIRGTSKKLSQNRSSSNLKTFKIENRENDNNSNFLYQNNSILIRNSSNTGKIYGTTSSNQKNNHDQKIMNYSNLNRSRLSSAAKDKESDKVFKFGMSYDEWHENKNKQLKITKSLNIIKENQLREYAKIEEKIDENYNKIINDNVQTWMQKKFETRRIEELKKQKIEEIKQAQKAQKEIIKQEKLEKWFIKQANLTEMELLEKKKKEEEKRIIDDRKHKIEEIKKLESEKCYQEWLMKKNIEKKNKEIDESNNDSRSNNQRNSFSRQKSSNKKRYQEKLKINIGPYSIAKELREYKKKIDQGLEEIDYGNSEGDDLENIDDYQDQEMNHKNIHMYNYNRGISGVNQEKINNYKNMNNSKNYINYRKNEVENEENNTDYRNYKNSIMKNNQYTNDQDYEENYDQEKQNNFENSENISNNMDYDENNYRNNENDDDHSNQNEQKEYTNNFEKEKIEDSLQELSSIKKDTPPQDDD